jgi:hypothetical protein
VLLEPSLSTLECERRACALTLGLAVGAWMLGGTVSMGNKRARPLRRARLLLGSVSVVVLCYVARICVVLLVFPSLPCVYVARVAYSLLFCVLPTLGCTPTQAIGNGKPILYNDDLAALFTQAARGHGCTPTRAIGGSTQKSTEPKTLNPKP